MKGNCIIVACQNIVKNKELLFCYAYVSGRGKLEGQRILHAWNELGDVIFDSSNGNKVVIRKQKVIKLMLKHKTYGGWIK